MDRVLARDYCDRKHNRRNRKPVKENRSGNRAHWHFTSVSCAAIICHFPARLTHVSVHTRHRFAAFPSFIALTELSLPYTIARLSLKKRTFTGPSWQSLAGQFGESESAEALSVRSPLGAVP